MSPSQREKPPSSVKRKTSSSQPTLISNYFKKIESPTEKWRPPPPPRNVPDSTAVNEDHDEERPRSPKRLRLETPHNGEDLPRPATPPANTERNALATLMGPKVKEFRPPPESPRTSRYKYIAYSPEKADEVENTSPEELEKRKSVHEKFVQKLGRADSLTVIRKQSEQGDNSASDEEAPQDDEEEEEPTPEVVKNLRGKYAAKPTYQSRAIKTTNNASTANTKLTPLERQFVEIKKKYPDTLLLIEVGYKFRFFGEDAKVCSPD